MYIYNSDSLKVQTTSNINITIPAGYTKLYVIGAVQHNYGNASQSFSSDIIINTNNISNYNLSGINGQSNYIIKNLLMTEYTISDEGGTLIYSVSNTHYQPTSYPTTWQYLVILSN